VIRLRIGELRQVIEATLRDAFELCAAGTQAEGARLEIEWVFNTWRCSACGQARRLDDDDGCPCGAAGAVDRMEGCDDLLLTSMDLEKE
jgi:hydrogenase nickel incorporation protein HypA/HybF